MFVYNFKLNVKKTIIACFIIAIIIAFIVEGIAMYRNKQKEQFDFTLDNSNFTNVLKDVHNDIERNVGKTIKISGFIFTMPDFKEGYFVCGRNMIFDNDEKVVGFLCNYKNIDEFEESEWVELTGHFIKGYYMSDMPIIQVDSIKKTDVPSNTYVDPPKSDVDVISDAI